MPAPHPRTEHKTADELLFSHYLRTGQRLAGAAAQAFLETKARDETRAEQQKSAESLLFSHYLRTGVMLAGEAGEQFLERKYNHNHDPDDGRFTFGPGGGSLAGRTMAARIGHMAVLSQLPMLVGASAAPRPAGRAEPLPSDASDPIGAIIWDRMHPEARSPKPPAQIRQPARADRAVRRSSLASWPIAGATVASLNRRDKPHEGNPTYGRNREGGKRFHRGIDIKAPEGTPVRSASPGQVVHVAPNPSGTFGYQVLIYHGHGMYTQYAHLQRGSIMVRSGQNVASGEQIARVGRTGNVPKAGDAHLHFEVRIGSGAPAVAGGHTGNPLDYLPR